MKSLYTRYFVVTTVLILISFVLLGGAFMFSTYRHLMDRNQENLGKTASSAAQLSSAYSITGELQQNWNLRMSLTLAASVSGEDILICDTRGRVVLCSDYALLCEHMGQSVPDSAVKSTLENGSFAGIGTLGGIYNETRYLHGEPIYFAGTSVASGIVFVSEEAGDMVSLFWQLTRIFGLMAVFVLVMTFAVTSIMTHRQVNPLREMAQTARRFAHGDYEARVSDYGREDEIGELNVAFNSMADSMENAEALRRDFVANVSHELKTPMTTISGFVDGILDGTIPEDRIQGCLETVSAETKRLSKLVSSMLEISRLQKSMSNQNRAAKTEKFDISEMLRLTILGLEQRITKKGLDVELFIDEDEDVWVRGEKDRIIQVVYNLLDNAIKFALPGTPIGLGIEKKAGKAEVFVRDQGETIPEEELATIFERFHKADQSRSMDREGLGLGLYIVKTILNAHDEDIWVTSRDGLTEFRFTLTLAKK